MKRMSGNNYNDWSKEQLIRHIHKLENVFTDGKKNKKVREMRPLDFSAYPTRRVAFKLAYFGWNYNGFASQMSYKDDGSLEENSRAPAGSDSVVTVEDIFFDALLRTRLIQSPRTCSYSRCGRTDAGVSSTGQVIALNVRSTRKSADGENGEIPIMEDLAAIAHMLNRTLPEDIRVLAYCPVKDTFNARFSCNGRKYKYFFSGNGLSVENMRIAAAKLIGTHDFRHFCRKDPSKNIQNFQRTIYSASINEVDPTTNFFEFEIHGSAFLYHQVRCIMAVLFLVGSGKEPAEVVDFMLDAEKLSATPRYDMASETPLVLYQCYYPEECNLNFVEIGEDAHFDEGLYKLWQQHYIKATTLNLVLKDRVTANGKACTHPAIRLANHAPIFRKQ